MIKKTLAFALVSFISSLSLANVDTVKNNLIKQHPKLNIENIQTTDMKGIYSGSMDGQVVYVGEDAQHILVGSMYRLSDQKNLTKDLVLKQNSIDWKKLPLQDAVKSVRGNGKRQIAIFSDPNCPYCKQLETELSKLNDVTIYTFIYPIKNQSIAVSKQVFCEKAPALAWSNLISKGIQPSSKKTCANPIERNLSLGKSLGLNGTPAIIFSNGFKVMGSHPAQEIEKMWKELGL
ncbi:DsbC family protein [Acinetobacter terrae]|uniref:Thiol:disulfide interchange protein n=1 Tax=Acinetobacter terrae TaxID=2731247 RepID=A0A7Y2WC90_9GAMM|nr:DsbC family protein [Acinetobacter terrae]NNH39781.1 DsbC family protein [Acinetobacter terrae]NNH79130.1 DsbC family protein [Acinetobacter terrae]OAL85728.1 thiol:disulfide interchange protein [Acinetobacter terrae]